LSDATGYDASQIQVLEGLEAVRRRPSMYIGSTDTLGLHHLVYEVVDNSIDEAMAGYCTEINVSIRQDGSVSVRDNGRGIPVDIHPQYNRPALEIVMTMLHAGGKFDHESYSFSGGLHGVGVSVVNALSEWMEVEVRRNRRIYWQRYEHGNVASEVEVRGESEHTGTTVTFKPDATIFEETEYNFDTLSSRLRELAFLNRGLNTSIPTKKRCTNPLSTSPAARTEHRSKWRCSTTTPITRTSSPTPTISTPVRVALISWAFERH
jgi:DNA gyrase subunit B